MHKPAIAKHVRTCRIFVFRIICLQCPLARLDAPLDGYLHHNGMFVQKALGHEFIFRQKKALNDSGGSMLKKICVAALAILPFLYSGSAGAQETTSITYDALGRVTRVIKSGGPANGVQTDYSLDAAGNRTNVKVAGSPNGAGNPGGGASSSTTIYIVVPLNGFTLIPVSN